MLEHSTNSSFCCYSIGPKTSATRKKAARMGSLFSNWDSVLFQAAVNLFWCSSQVRGLALARGPACERYRHRRIHRGRR
jgi:hypothetical protein